MRCQNYPNPFNPSTTIKYSLPDVETRHASSLRLIIYNIHGREISTFVSEKQQPGNYEVVFNVNHLLSRTYFYRISAGSSVKGAGQTLTKTMKFILLK